MAPPAELAWRQLRRLPGPLLPAQRPRAAKALRQDLVIVALLLARAVPVAQQAQAATQVVSNLVKARTAKALVAVRLGQSVTPRVGFALAGEPVAVLMAAASPLVLRALSPALWTAQWADG